MYLYRIKMSADNTILLKIAFTREVTINLFQNPTQNKQDRKSKIGIEGVEND